MKDIASRLQHRVVIEQPDLAEQGGGQYAVSWSAFATVWADIEPFFSRSVNAERLQEEQLNTPVSHKVTIRYLMGVNEAMRMVYGSRVFNIRSVVYVRENNEILELLVQENAAV